jgi:hypothetical protein
MKNKMIPLHRIFADGGSFYFVNYIIDRIGGVAYLEIRDKIIRYDECVAVYSVKFEVFEKLNSEYPEERKIDGYLEYL